MNFDSSLKPRLIYVFRINDEAHQGCLKIGETSLPDGSDITNLPPNSHELNRVAKKRIDQYTRTAAIKYELLYTECTLYVAGGTLKSFNDSAVHEVLIRSGIRRRKSEHWGKEWFEADLETIKKAIKAAKDGRTSLTSNEITKKNNPIVFRPEQREAIEKTIKQFKKGNSMLWNAKMRFGKTLSALQVVKNLNFRRTLILTHRPVVDDGWYEDFKKIFYDREDFRYGSKIRGEKFSVLEAGAKEETLRYVYFASIQDLRGSETVGGKFDKNNEIFSTSWNCLIVDEAHEGTQTQLGKNVIAELTKSPTTKQLSLSGTPFNLFDDYKEDQIYTWDYVMEQKAKAQWDLDNCGDTNPYAGLPKMNIFTYNLGKLLNRYRDEDISFNFREFFRVNDAGNFVHENDVASFLNLLCKKDDSSAYPFSTEEYRNNFRHTLWMVPGVKSALALQRMLKKHTVFQHFEVVNVAGDGDEEKNYKDALKEVENAIGNDPDQTRTITLSCGRLTTGVSVKPWTAVLMLSGSFNTAAAGYMQTIFRVQTPATINGRVKEQCYVFDFAPDRTLKVLAEAAKVSTKPGSSSSDDESRKAMRELLNFCPVIGIDGSKMHKYDVESMMHQLKKVYIEHVVNKGFDDVYLYNTNELMNLDSKALEKFEGLKRSIGTTQPTPKPNDIDINNQGVNGGTQEPKPSESKGTKQKPNQELSEEEKKRREELQRKRKQRDTAISILRGISIRMPLMIYGAEIDDDKEEITIDNFTDKIDPLSWEEFMPRGVTKNKFNSFKKYYEPDVFTASAKRIRNMVRSADLLSIEQRIERITQIFATFRNPDKETVLTPWRVVNMHISDTIGGYTFFDADFDEKKPLSEPRFVDRGDVTANVFNTNTHILEINSKTGLYPLFMAYSTYRARLVEMNYKPNSIDDEWAVWSKVVAENIFVICKTPMAKSITRRTLVGFRQLNVNTRYFEDLINQIKNKPNNFIKKVARGKTFWKATNDNNMKFNAVVGNPPYQDLRASEKTVSNAAFATAIYPSFFDISRKIATKYISLIMPSRWMTKVGQGISNDWVDELLNSNHFISITDFLTSSSCFSGVEIKGGICYFLYDDSYKGKCCYTLYDKNQETHTSSIYLNESGTGIVIRDPQANNIIIKIIDKEGNYFTYNTFRDIVSPKHFFDNDILLGSNWTGFTEQKDQDHPIKIYVNKKLSDKGYGWIKPSDIPRNNQAIALHKVFIPKVGGSGTDAIVLGKPFYGEPFSVCSYTYLVIGYNQESMKLDEFSCMSIIKYIYTRLFRYLVSIKKKTQDNARDVFQFVPLQDFTEKSDIDWSDSIDGIDRQLYKKYGLTKEEIGFIESMIKPME